MIESFKTKLGELLNQKEISLAMLFNREGKILWHKGRKISGSNIEKGSGFSKSYIQKILRNALPVNRDDIAIEAANGFISDSASELLIKSLLIIPVSCRIYLYIDSGVKEYFTDSDREIFKILGEMLSEVIFQIKKRESDINGITGTSEKINKVRDLVLKYSFVDEPVLLLGETGAGKSHLAELIHIYSGRKGRFYTVNTPGIPQDLFESEIFGHKKGAFTDALSDKEGFVAEAAGGTLFFDEICEVPPSFQTKLLRFMETRKYTPLGDTIEKTADVRIVAATNKNLLEAIARKEFREDLYYRLSILEIHIPPLRERKEDIKALVKDKIKYLKGKKTRPCFWEEMLQHDWPGNVRELITVLTRVGIHAENPVTGVKLREILNSGSFLIKNSLKDKRTKDLLIKLNRGENFWQAVWQPFINRDISRSTIKEVLKTCFQGSNNSFTRMLALLNLQDTDYHSLMSLMRKYKIDPRK